MRPKLKVILQSFYSQAQPLTCSSVVGLPQCYRLTTTEHFVLINSFSMYLNVQMSTKDVIGQEVIVFDAIASVAKLLDQLCDGLRSLGVLYTMRAFPDLFVHLFTYTACVTSNEVLEAVFVDEDRDLEVCDTIVMYHLKRFISESSEEGK